MWLPRTMSSNKTLRYLGGLSEGLVVDECLSMPTAYSSFENNCFAYYKLLGELNRGATAVVYEALDTRNCATIVALKFKLLMKVLFRDVGETCSRSELYLQREIQFSSVVAHHNVVKLLDVVRYRGQTGLAMELVRGLDLLDYIIRCGGQLPEEVAIFYFRQLVEAVDHMHANGVAHLDLKPENCMMDLQGHTLKVIDFGLAESIKAKISLGCGTIYTIAPECIVQGEQPPPSPDAVAVDLWGLGVTLYIMLCGRFPFQDGSRPHDDQKTIFNTLKGNVNPIPKHVSPTAKELVLSLLSKNPRDRPSLLEISSHKFVLRRIHIQKIIAFEAEKIGSYHNKQIKYLDADTFDHNVEASWKSKHIARPATLDPTQGERLFLNSDTSELTQDAVRSTQAKKIKKCKQDVLKIPFACAPSACCPDSNWPVLKEEAGYKLGITLPLARLEDISDSRLTIPGETLVCAEAFTNAPDRSLSLSSSFSSRDECLAPVSQRDCTPCGLLNQRWQLWSQEKVNIVTDTVPTSKSRGRQGLQGSKHASHLQKAPGEAAASIPPQESMTCQSEVTDKFV